MTFFPLPRLTFLSIHFWQSEEQNQNLSADLYEKVSAEF